MADRLLSRKKNDAKKLYSIHAPESGFATGVDSRLRGNDGVEVYSFGTMIEKTYLPCARPPPRRCRACAFRLK